MNNFSSAPFIKIGQQSISIHQALLYLQAAGKLSDFVQDVAQQHILRQAIQTYPGVEISLSELEAHAKAFRQLHQLENPEALEQWLTASNLSYTAFLDQLTDGLKLAKLKTVVTQEAVVGFFEKNQTALDKIKLTYIATPEQTRATDFQNRIHNGEASFDDILMECVREAMLDHTDSVTVKKELLRRGQIRDEIQEMLQNAQPGELLEPVQVDDCWWLIRVDEISEAQLEGELRQQLESEFFDQWLANELQSSQVQIVTRQLVESVH